MARNPECPCRQPAKDFAFGYQSVEPGHALLPSQNHHLPVVKRRKIVIRLDRQDGIGLWPVVDRRPPNPREIEPVTIRERETEGSVRNSEAGTRQRWVGNVLPFDRTTFTARASPSRGRSPHGNSTISTSPSWRLMITRRSSSGASDWKTVALVIVRT